MIWGIEQGTPTIPRAGPPNRHAGRTQLRASPWIHVARHATPNPNLGKGTNVLLASTSTGTG
eukprot:5539696-Prorocentrum_lima.AAC.1